MHDVGSPEKRTYDVSHAQNRYVRLPLLVFHTCVDFGMCMSKIKAKKCLKIKKAHYHLVIFRNLGT
jgi:hypothetical protein